MTDSLVGRRERKKEETKQKIFLAAIKLFNDKGFQATTVDEIAEAADVSKGTFFNYFPRKEALVEYLAEENLEAVEEAAVGGDVSATERIRLIYDALSVGYAENPELARTVMKSAMERLCSPAKDGAWMRFEALAIQVISDGQARGEFRKEQQPNVVHGALVSCFIGSVIWWLGERAESDDPRIRDVALKDVIRDLQTVALNGICAKDA